MPCFRGVQGPRASGLLCRLYAHGINAQGTEDSLAFRWCTVAAASGLPDSMATLAGLYLDGKGTARDPRDALVWALIAAARVPDSASRLLSDADQRSARGGAEAWEPIL